MVDSLDQPVRLKCCNCPVNGIKGNGIEVLSDLFKHLSSRGMIPMFQEGFEDFDPLMSNSESLGSAGILEVIYYRRYTRAVVSHTPTTTLLWSSSYLGINREKFHGQMHKSLSPTDSDSNSIPTHPAGHTDRAFFSSLLR